MIRTIQHNPRNAAEVSAIQTPGDQPDGVLIDPESVDLTDESSEEVGDADGNILPSPRLAVDTIGFLTQLADVARRTGYPVVEVDGWKTRGRPGGMAGVRTITEHHTANGGAAGNYPSLRVVRDGRSDLPGPLAQYGLGRDGTIYVIAAGKCNHAGVSLKTDYTNSYAIGIEAEAVGVPGTAGDWPDVQMDSYHRLCKALVKEFGLNMDDARGHKETCSPVGRKSDPDFSMSTFRAAVASVNLDNEVESDVELTDKVKYTPQAAKRAGVPEDTFSHVLQWSPGVRAARDEIAAGFKEQGRQLAALTTTVNTMAGVLNALAAGTSPEVKAAFDAGIAELKEELANVDVHITLDGE